MKTSQKGFAVLESLLILVIIGIIGGTGWYTWHTKNQTDKILSEASNTAQTTKTVKSTLTQAQQYLTVKEWGVRAPYDGSLTLQYQVVSQAGQTWAYFSSDQLAASDPGCSVENGAAGLINRYAAGSKLYLEDGSQSDQTIEQAIASGAITTYSHVGDYYYFPVSSQSACGSSQASNDLQSQTHTVVVDIAKSLQAIAQ